MANISGASGEPVSWSVWQESEAVSGSTLDKDGVRSGETSSVASADSPIEAPGATRARSIDMMGLGLADSLHAQLQAFPDTDPSVAADKAGDVQPEVTSDRLGVFDEETVTSALQDAFPNCNVGTGDSPGDFAIFHPVGAEFACSVSGSEITLVTGGGDSATGRVEPGGDLAATIASLQERLGLDEVVDVDLQSLGGAPR